jgi:2-keto-4-pentenoate hydratase/2-oxohepta-3-ene-1,7-dioic acid hydratase in catechol pathway
VCVGRNYHAHAAELGGEVPAEPLLFLKPPSSLLTDGSPIQLPPGVGRVDFEGEIAFLVGVRARHVSEKDGWAHLSHVLPANDVTARALQRADDQWTRAKGFDTFCPVGTPVPLEEVDPDSLAVETRVNGVVRQSDRAARMAFSPPFLVSYISGIMTLEPGDLILTGTPSGVGPLDAGDVVEVTVPGVGSVKNPVAAGRPPSGPHPEGLPEGRDPGGDGRGGRKA